MILKELIFLQFLCWEGVVVSKRTDFNSYYFGHMVVFKELIFNS